MLLSQDELERLVAPKHRSPHELLGMHPLGDGSGLVVRAFLPNAATVEAHPTHEKAKPKIKLKRLHDAGLFEGVTTKANRVYAYDLVITDHRGLVRRTRDPYSFLPTLGESDLYLLNKGDERRVYLTTEGVMPIYGYQCQACGHGFEVMQKMSDPAPGACPACGQAEIRKQLNAAGFQLKGGGWYATDFKGSKKSSADADSGPTAGGCGSGGCGRCAI